MLVSGVIVIRFFAGDIVHKAFAQLVKPAEKVHDGPNNRILIPIPEFGMVVMLVIVVMMVMVMFGVVVAFMAVCLAWGGKRRLIRVVMVMMIVVMPGVAVAFMAVRLVWG